MTIAESSVIPQHLYQFHIFLQQLLPSRTIWPQLTLSTNQTTDHTHNKL